MENKVIQDDCLNALWDIPDKSVDMIFADLPYGTTACSWDTIIPFEPLWEQLERVIKDNGAMVFTGSQPFTSALVMSNPKLFKQSLVWEKTRPTNVLNARKMFMKWHEDILIFYKKLPTFNPQMTEGKAYTKTQHKQNREGQHSGFTGEKEGYFYDNKGLFYPKSVLKYATEMHTSEHPTQKPVALLEYLIKTYTNEGDTVLDPTAGSFTTAIACENLKRNWVCIEKEEKYCEIGRKRIEENRLKLTQPPTK